MRRLILFVLFCLNIVHLEAQVDFWEETSFIGAFATSPTPRWTDDWCEFNPQYKIYPTTTVNITANITTNTTWTNTNVYHLNNSIIYVKPGATLTIEPGTIIRGSGKGTLVIERGAKIFAQGTANQPIVFTSNANPGLRNYGDWGGVVICGAAKHNLIAGSNAIVEGGIGNVSTQTGVHGGNNDDDSSGVFSYVRIEFCGISLTPDPNSEINGLSLYSVGRKTKIDHVQVSYSGDDSFEWFGGTVDAKYLVAFRGLDDDFDTDNGFRGRVQFACAIRDSRFADQSGSNGFESDNDANGSYRMPATRPTFSNVTIIGPINPQNGDTVNTNYRRALHLRRNTKLSVYNSIFVGFPSAGFLLDGRNTAANYCLDTLAFRSNIIAGCNFDWRLSNADTLCIGSTNDFINRGMLTNDTLHLSEEIELINPFGNYNSDPDLRPATGSLALGTPYFDFIYSSIGIDDYEESTNFELNVFPNPAFDYVSVNIHSVVNSSLILIITDAQYKVIRSICTEIKEGDNLMNVNLAGLSTGLYFISFYFDNKSVHQKLLIK
ncbi:MAG: T9SS type A sorting domain-containing protein [Flavobacteriales bacterium]|nr:T9SS type A sorting domain-containing protein [Flavobacteriales bacterium]